MSAQPRKVGAEIRDLLQSLQRAKATPLTLFQVEDEGLSGVKTQTVYKIVTLAPDTKFGADLWKELHNDPNISIIAEKDYMSHRDGLKTVVRYAEIVRAYDPDVLVDELMP